MAIKGASFKLFLLENIFYKNTGYKDEGMLYILSFLFQKNKNKQTLFYSQHVSFVSQEKKLTRIQQNYKKILLFQKASIHWHNTTN